MAGYEAATSLTDTVHLSGDYRAQVRALRADEEDAVQAAYLGSRKQRAAVQTNQGATSTSVDLEMDNGALIRETLLRGIASWTLDDVDGTIWPVDAAHLGKLTGGDRNKLFVAITTLTGPPDDAEKKG